MLRYTGDFLAGNGAPWAAPMRQRLRTACSARIRILREQLSEIAELQLAADLDSFARTLLESSEA